ncbi:MAG: hypothetical protein WCF67_14360 [Chitinophagaceae bacterium]
MNTGRDLMKRLLHLLPVQSIKDEYHLTGNAEAIIENLTNNQTQTNLRNFIFRHSSITRQNVYIFELNKNFYRQGFNAANFPFTVENPRTEQGQFVFHCLPRTIYHVYLSNPVITDELHFLHPVTVKITNRTLIIHFTKLVKNISHYYPEDRVARKSKQENTEEEILSRIKQFFAAYNPQALDINVGVKHLWDIDDVDCYKIQWRRQFSSATEVMDGTLTFKERYPNDYQQIIQTPLVKTVFKCLRTDDYLCKEFTTDPENGLISTNQFADNINQVSNVISTILTNN